MNKYKVFFVTHVEAEDTLPAMFKAFHKLDPLGDVQFQFECIDVHAYTNEGWTSETGLAETIEGIFS